MQAVVWILRLVVVTILIWFALKNAQQVEVFGLPGQSWQAPLVFVLLVAFVAGVLIGLTAAMTVLGIALVSTSPTYLPPGAVGMSFLFIAPLVVLPIGVPMMAANHGGRPKVGPLGALQSVRVSLSGLQIRF